MPKIDYPFETAIFIGAILFTLFNSYLIILFGIKFTGQQANNWLITSSITTIHDVILLQPFSILAKTYFMFKA